MFESIYQQQKIKSIELRSSSPEQRKAKLKALLLQINQHQEDMLLAAQKDFSKPQVETLLSEILLIQHELKLALQQLSTWMRPQVVRSGLLLLGYHSEIQTEPKGTCLIISPWNYPWQLSLIPLISALAAGNTVVLKPSELTPHCSELLKKMLEQVFKHDEVYVALGDAKESQELLKLPFDHIFFTGSTQVGKIVMRAAAENLSSLTLELGGKCPLIVDETADLTWAAERIFWGKWINAGQSCVAPDTLFVQKNIWPNLQKEIKIVAQNFLQKPEDFSQIITERHWQRLSQISQQCEAPNSGWELSLEFGKEFFQNNRRLPLKFFVLKDKHQAEKTNLYQEEIFGPFVAVHLYENFDSALDSILSLPAPLSTYCFSQNQKQQQILQQKISSGAFVVNDVLVHLLNTNLPFGGVKSSGMGHYHGEFGFLSFSNKKAHLKQGGPRFISRYFSPPYSENKKKWAQKLIRFLG